MELTPSQSAALASMADVAADMGFDIAPLGDGTWAINGVPADIDGISPAELLAAMADDVAATGVHDPESVRTTAALALAMDALTADLMRLPAPAYTPDGLRVIAVVDNDAIDRLFQ